MQLIHLFQIQRTFHLNTEKDLGYITDLCLILHLKQVLENRNAMKTL